MTKHEILTAIEQEKSEKVLARVEKALKYPENYPFFNAETLDADLDKAAASVGSGNFTTLEDFERKYNL